MNVPGHTQDLHVRPALATDESEIVSLLSSALGDGPTGSMNGEFLRWKHQENPFGTSPGLVATNGDQVVAVRLFLRWRLEARGRTFLAVRAVDTATHPAFRGRGLFKSLTMGLLRQLEDAGEVDLVFNTPNGNSRPGYLKMGWRDVGVLPVRLAVHRPVRFARGVRAANAATAFRGAPAPRVPPRALPACPFPTAAEVLAARAGEVASVLAEMAPVQGLHTPRSSAYLDWRYAQAPGLDYRCIPLEQGGRITGLAVGRLRHRADLIELTLSEVLARGQDHCAARRLLTLARRSGADHVVVHTSGQVERRAAARAGYLAVPRYGVGLVTNPRRDLGFDATDARSWRLSLGDIEVF